MRAFTALYTALDETTRTSAKVSAMAEYFAASPAPDAAWAVSFLSGQRPKRLVPARLFRLWAATEAQVPAWLFSECYEAVGDLAETVALLVPAGPGSEESLAYWVERRLLPLAELDEEGKHREMRRAWAELDRGQIFVWNKLITGAFRVGVSRRLVLRALERVTQIDRATLAHRLAGRWMPTPEAYRALFDRDVADADISRPYPFFLAHPLDGEPAALGARESWQAEWKWDGIRAQLIHRAGQVFLWSRGEELVTERFPEIAAAASRLADGTVLDGELLAWRGDRPLSFAALQRRIGRKKLGAKILAEVPAALVAYDLLELDGVDLRAAGLAERRARLAALVADLPAPGALKLSPVVEADSWTGLVELRERSRERLAEGLMLKRLSSPYGVGRRRGDWWKWKVDPYTADAVLLYAQRGSGRRASLYTDYTFGVWDGDQLVPFAKAYSGLDNEEILRVDRFVRRNSLERFGPVRRVRPRLVFELAFEGIQESSRHKSGVAVRFPRIHRWRQDKKPEEADTLETIKRLLGAAGKPGGRARG